MSEYFIKKDQISSLLDYAKSLHRSGKSDAAYRIYLKVLKEHSDNIEALRLRAVIYLDNGDYTKANKYLQRALRIAPDNPEIHNNLGSLYQKQKHYQKALWHFEKALDLETGFSKAANNLGNLWQELGDTEKAVSAYEKALAAEPETAETWNNLGNAFSRCNRNVEAEKLFLKALEINPHYKDAWNNLGICYVALGLTEQALAAYNRALAISCNDALALNNKGNLLLSSSRNQEALKCFEASTQANDLLPESWNGKGYAYRQLGELKKAEKCFRRCIDLKHNYAEAWNNLGLTLADQGKLDAALSAFRTALDIRPSYSACHSNLLLFLNYHPDVHASTLTNAHLNWAAAHQLYPTEGSTPASIGGEANKIRIGFVSADFRRHPVGYFLRPLLQHIDKEQFDITCYCNNRHSDDMTLDLKNYCDHWRTVSEVNNTDLARLIAKDKIDILIDLSGHTSGNRLETFSLRPAPIQVTWLGYPCTTALDSMDYILSDAISLPEYLHWQFTEQVLTMPHSRCCYSPPGYAPDVNELPALANRQITFGSFNNPVKLNAKTYRVWSDILQGCADSRLVLSWRTLSDPTIANSIYDQFAKHDIEASRITLLGGRREHQQVFRDYQSIDIALDTFPFSGGLTTCESLWMGVPVLTLAGKRPASRQTAALLAEVGLERLVSFSIMGYIEQSIMLASDLPQLSHIRNTLRADMRNSTLADASRFCKDFETIMSRVYTRKRQKNQSSAG